MIIRNVSTSHTSQTRVTYPLKCYHCKVNGFTNQESYERHGIRFHRNMPLYPGYADLNALGLQPQDMLWEQEPRTDIRFEEKKDKNY